MLFRLWATAFALPSGEAAEPVVVTLTTRVCGPVTAGLVLALRLPPSAAGAEAAAEPAVRYVELLGPAPEARVSVAGGAGAERTSWPLAETDFALTSSSSAAATQAGDRIRCRPVAVHHDPETQWTTAAYVLRHPALCNAAVHELRLCVQLAETAAAAVVEAGGATAVAEAAVPVAVDVGEVRVCSLAALRHASPRVGGLRATLPHWQGDVGAGGVVNAWRLTVTLSWDPTAAEPAPAYDIWRVSQDGARPSGDAPQYLGRAYTVWAGCLFFSIITLFATPSSDHLPRG
jgi:hypothetical protein